MVAKFLQLGIFFIFVTLGIMKLLNISYHYSIFFSDISFFASLIILIYTTKLKIGRLTIITPSKKDYKEKLMDIILGLTVIVGVVFTIITIYLQAVIPQRIVDGLSIIALSISLPNEYLSSVFCNIMEDESFHRKKSA